MGFFASRILAQDMPSSAAASAVVIFIASPSAGDAGWGPFNADLTYNIQNMATIANDVLPLRQHVQSAIRRYLDDMGSTQPDHLHKILLAQVEPPLIEEVLRRTQGNQSKAAQILGITRNTLRSKMQRYDISRTRRADANAVNGDKPSNGR